MVATDEHPEPLTGEDYAGTQGAHHGAELSVAGICLRRSGALNQSHSSSCGEKTSG